MAFSPDEQKKILLEIRDGVRLIAAAMAKPLRERLHDEFLKSNQRKKMYREFDGQQSYEAIAKKVGVTAEAVRQFTVALEEAGFVVLNKQDGKTCPRRVL
jgi:biotin operon repressor